VLSVGSRGVNELGVVVRALGVDVARGEARDKWAAVGER